MNGEKEGGVSPRDAELQRLERRLEDQERQAAVLSRDLSERVRRIAELSQKIQDLEKQRDEIARERNELDKTLHEIWESQAWKLIKILRRTRQWMIPRGSRRAAFFSTLKRGAQAGRQGGMGSLVGKFWGWALKGRIMNWYAFSFDSCKRARLSAHAADLRSLKAPSEPGLVSVILPAFNGARLLGEALDSILAQTYSNLEVIAINDGSTDETGAILDEYARRDSRIQVIHQENRKIPRTLSRGFRAARGEFLTWTSVDNRLAPDFLEQMVSCLRRRPDWDMVYANLDIIGEDGRPLRQSPWYRNYQRPPGSEHIHLPEDPSELNVWPNNYVGGAFLYRDRVAWLLGDYSSLRFTTEDYDYWMRVNALLNLRHADFLKPVYEYRFHRQSLTHRDEELGITEGRKFLMVFDDFRRNFSLGPATWIVDADSPGDSGSELSRQLGQQIQGAGHNLLPKMTFAPEGLPRLWFPSVFVRITEHPGTDGSPPPGIPRNTLKVLLADGAGVLPAAMNAEWDLCLAVRPHGPLPRLERPYQGWLGVDDIRQLFTAVDIRVRSQQLAAIEAEIEQAEKPSPLKLTVIICTHRRSRGLPKAIESAARQTLPREDYEVLVVNNDPAENYPETIVGEMRRNWFRDFPEHIRLIRCLTPGLSHARNAGISEARGGILTFFDDDAIALPDCLEKVLQAFEQHPEAGVVGGHIRLKIPEPRPEALIPGWERYWSQFLTDYREYTEVEHWWEFPWGANWSARRKALLEIGGFRANYGRRGNDFGGGEELVAASLVKRLGYRIAVVPGAEVLHDVDVDRYSFEHVRRTIAAATLVNYRIQKDLYVPMESSLIATRREIGSAFRRLVTGIWGGIRRSGGREKEETAYILRARLKLLKRQIQDFFSRLRRPVAKD
jgi:glycosyltransferase involved in cell wall biosynthesis